MPLDNPFFQPNKADSLTAANYHNVSHPSIVSKWLNSKKGTALRNPVDAVKRRQNKYLQMSSSLFGDNAERDKVRHISDINFRDQVDKGLQDRRKSHYQDQQEESRLLEAMSIPINQNLSSIKPQTSSLQSYGSSTAPSNLYSFSQPTNYGLQPNTYGSVGQLNNPLPNYNPIGSNLGNPYGSIAQPYGSLSQPYNQFGGNSSYEPSFLNNDYNRRGSINYTQPTSYGLTTGNQFGRGEDKFQRYNYYSDQVEDIQQRIRDQQVQENESVLKNHIQQRKQQQDQEKYKNHLEDLRIEDNFLRQQRKVQNEFEEEKMRMRQKEDMFKKRREAHQRQLEDITKKIPANKLINGRQKARPEMSIDDTIVFTKLESRNNTRGLPDNRPLHSRRSSLPMNI